MIPGNAAGLNLRVAAVAAAKSIGNGNSQNHAERTFNP